MVVHNDIRSNAHPRRKPAPLSRNLGGFSVPVTASLLLLDGALILVHLVFSALDITGAIATIPEVVRIDRDWSPGEIANYGKWIGLVILSFLIFRRQRQFVFLAFTLLAIVGLLDDSLQLHEQLNAALVSALLSHPLPKDIREMIFMAFEGAVITGPLVLGWIKAPPQARLQVAPLLMLAAGAAFCAGAVDFLHAQAPAYSKKEALLGVAEDGGEMIFLSLMVGYAAGLLAGQERR